MPQSHTDDLKNPNFAAHFLQEALKDNSLEPFLVGLGETVKVSKGMRQVAKETALSRESLYRSLSTKGNPQFATLRAVLNSLGLDFSIVPIDSK